MTLPTSSTSIPQHEHEFNETISIDVYYPDHQQRTESDLFARTKHKLINVQNVPCFICGTYDLREVHHYHIEWAFANAVDWNKMKSIHPLFDWSTYKTPEDFVDSEYNMMILCQNHHRHKDTGIHMLPYPIWIVQKTLLANFDLLPPSV